MNILEQEFIKGFIRMCSDGFAQGWHERNGGNLTYRMKDEEVKYVQSVFSYHRSWEDIGTEVPELYPANPPGWSKTMRRTNSFLRFHRNPAQIHRRNRNKVSCCLGTDS